VPHFHLLLFFYFGGSKARTCPNHDISKDRKTQVMVCLSPIPLKTRRAAVVLNNTLSRQNNQNSNAMQLHRFILHEGTASDSLPARSSKNPDARSAPWTDEEKQNVIDIFNFFEDRRHCANYLQVRDKPWLG
jgi:hypothetical protein